MIRNNTQQYFKIIAKNKKFHLSGKLNLVPIYIYLIDILKRGGIMKKIFVDVAIIFWCCLPILTNPRQSLAQMNHIDYDHPFPPRLYHEAEMFNETDPGAAEERRYGAIARAYLQNTGKYRSQNSAQNSSDETWNLKFSEPNITGDTQFGKCVANAGDVNGDGYDDVLIGACHYKNNTGRVYLYFGGAVMDTVADVIMTGETVDNYFGISIAGTGGY